MLATNTWAGGTGSFFDFFDKTKWSLGRAPVASDDVVINKVGSYQITANSPVSVNSLTLGAGSGIEELVLNASLQTKAGLTIQAGGKLTVASGANLFGTGAISNSDGGTVTLGSSAVLSALTNKGALNVAGDTQLRGSLTTTSTSSITLRGDGRSVGGTLTVAAGFTNNGSILLTDLASATSAQLFVTSGTLVNSTTGRISVNPGTGGTRSLNAAIANAGTITVSTDTSWNLPSAASVASSNTGVINISAGKKLTANAGFLNSSGSVNGTGGTLVLNSTTFSPVGNFAPTAAVVVNGGLINGTGNFTNSAGQTLTLNNFVQVSAPLTNLGTLLVTGGALISNTFTTGNGSAINVQATSSTNLLTVANGFTNNGTITLTDTDGTFSELDVTAGTLTNAAGGTISIAAGRGGGRSLNAAIANAGTITVSTDTNWDVRSSSDGRDLNASHTGVINIAAGKKLAVTGGIIDVSGSIVGIGGTLELNSTTFNVAGDIAPTASLVFNSGTIGGSKTFTNSAGRTLALTSGTNFNASLTNLGVLLVTGGALISNTFTTGNGSAINVQATSSTNILTIAKGFTNNGTITLTDTDGTFSELDVTTGTLTNAVGGTISIAAGRGGGRSLNAAIANVGAITVGADTTWVLQSSADGRDLNASHTGVINIAAGKKLAVTGGIIDVSGSIVGIGGTLELNSTTFNITRDIAPTASLIFNGGTIGGSKTFTNSAAQTLTLSQGASVNAPFINQGSLQVIGEASISGALTTSIGSSINLVASGATLLNVANSFTNFGTILLTDANGGSSRLAVTSGTLTNAASGKIITGSGAAGLHGIQAVVNNQGVLFGRVTVNGSLTNSGIIGSGIETNVVVVNGNFAQTSPGILNIAVGGTPTSGLYSHIDVSGTTALGGTLNTVLLKGFSPTAGLNYSAVVYRSASGAFSATNLNVGGGRSFNAAISSGSVVLTTATGGSSFASVDSATRVLTVQGTSGNDVIAVANLGAVNQIFDFVGVYVVSLNGLNATFSRGAFTSSILNGGSGDDVYALAVDTYLGAITVNDTVGGFDVLDLSTNRLALSANTVAQTVNLGLTTAQTVNNRLTLTLPTAGAIDAVLGGAGDDTLTGGAAGEVLVGNGGNDVIVGGGGRNILVGGSGSDRLAGGSDDDLLVGNATSLDGNVVAGKAIFSEWASPSSFAERIGHLSGLLPGGLNGSTVLTPATSIEDNASDILSGSAGLDWFFATLGDSVIDLQSNELVNFVAPVSITGGSSLVAVQHGGGVGFFGSSQIGVSFANPVGDKTVIITATAGTIVFDPVALGGLTSAVGAGTGSVRLVGSVNNLNAVLATLSYVAPLSGSSAFVTIAGIDGASSLQLTMSVLLTNAPPTISGGMSSLSMSRNTTIGFGGPSRLAVADIDAAAGAQLNVTLSATSGTISINTAGLASASGVGTGTVTFSGTVAQLNAALATFSYLSPATGTSANITVLVNDGQSMSTLTMAVAFATAPPVISGPVSLAAAIGSTISLPGVQVFAPDAGTSIVNVSITVTGGTLLLNTAGLSSSSGVGSSAVLISGTVAQLNVALATLGFKAPAAASNIALRLTGMLGSQVGPTTTTTITVT